jgi:hypothetical protein
MNDGTQDQVKVSFPANPTFSRIGRVAVAGLALRLDIDIADVERLRLAVDRAVSALHGAGRISLEARWEPDQLTITVDNPDHVIGGADSTEVTAQLNELADEVSVGPTSINIVLWDGRAGDTGAETEQLI